ncbi:MAG: hypothetical protein ACRD8O_24150 [Bryobacteraceae bacterium]
MSFARSSPIIAVFAVLAPVCAGEMDVAFARLYNFDFPGAHVILNRATAASPDDPFPHSIRASAYLFYELDRLGILESEFFADDKRIVERKKLKPDPGVRTLLFKAVNESQARAQKLLSANAGDTNALFSLCITYGVVTDYTALVEKRQISSLSSVKRSTGYAQRLLKADPTFYDAYLSTGLADYLIGSLPFFVRWFVRIDDIKGSKDQGIRNLTLAAQQGRYLKPFAKIVLTLLNIREKKPREAHVTLAELTRDFPENPLFRKELEKLTQRLR